MCIGRGGGEEGGAVYWKICSTFLLGQLGNIYRCTVGCVFIV